MPRTSLATAALLLGMSGIVSGCGGTPPTELPTTLTPSPEARAGMDFAQAIKLEKSRNPDAALEVYRRILRDFPETPQAKLATERIKTLGGQ